MPKQVDDEQFLAVCTRFDFDYKAVAHELGLDPNGVSQRIRRLRGANRATSNSAEVKALQQRLRAAEERLLTDAYVKERILRITSGEPKVPEWTLKTTAKSDLTGVPTLFASDWHWGEVVRPAEIGGVNEFNLKIARKRAETLINVATELLTQHLSSARYPGICLILGGDMLSGDIHEELSDTNEEPVMVAWLDLLGVLKWVVQSLEATFGRVFIVGVTGNHGRNTRKPRMKRRNHSNFDWLLYQVLRRDVESDKVSFLIPDGPDALFRLYHHRYMLTHGDQFRGGDGIIGPLGPITRGDIKKRSKQAQIQAGYDTLLMGHFHQLIQLDSLIVNGSLKGYDEYAHANNFKFESPRQALWITHPEYGITFQMPVYVERRHKDEKVAWASVAA